MSGFSSSSLRWLVAILQDRFGYEFMVSKNGSRLQLKLAGSLKVIEFDKLQSVFHRSDSDFPCYFWNVSLESFDFPVDDLLPAPSENELPTPLVELNNRGAIIHYDILGLTYWMLTRLEEVGRVDLDNHQRFPAVCSHAYKHGYLERPIVDEWLNILGQVIVRVWPNEIKLKKHSFIMRVSHDVDNPSQYSFKSWKTIIRMMVGHLVKRRDVKAFFQAPYVKLATINKLCKQDPFNTFDWLMSQSKANHIQSAFYFICGRTDLGRDSDYEIEHPAIRNLMREIHERGHEIGLHPSYNSFQSPATIKQEADRLRTVMREENILQDEVGGRMHYLRWEQPTTLKAWEKAGMSYDSTMGYADRPGFRCGTCFDYPAFDLVNQEILRLRIRPLIVMECSVIDKAYLGLGMTDDAKNKMLELKDICKKVDGNFNLLWHNSYFKTPKAKEIYKNILGF
jgi:hypothetical protein